MEGCAAEIKGSIYVHQFAEYLGLRFKDLADQEKVALCKTLNSAANDVNPGSQYLQLAYDIGDVFTEVYKDVVLRKKYDNQKNYVLYTKGINMYQKENEN